MARAQRFAEDWKGETYEKGEAQTFYNDFFNVFGLERRSRAFYEMHVDMFGDSQGGGYIDLFWPRVLLAEHKSAGYDLEKAMKQAKEYFLSIKEHDRPAYLLACDFRRFHLVDIERKKSHRFKLHELADNIALFDFMDGERSRPERVKSDPVNIRASEIMGRIHDRLEETGYPKGDTEYLLTRLAFCLFADDTGIFEDGIFEEYLRSPDNLNNDFGPRINHLFQVMDTPDGGRQTNLAASVAQFPYIDGDLFGTRVSIPAFDHSMRRLLIKACEYDWSKVSPAIFGSMFQSIMDKTRRRSEGAHYTSEENIMKIIRPLFLDDLEAGFESIRVDVKGDRMERFAAFQKRLAGLTFLDPACGAGNFLIIAYRELRRLELKVIQELHDPNAEQPEGLVRPLVDVDQFFGIENNVFSAKIAETAIWMMDHLMNMELGAKYGRAYMRIPLEKSPSIWHADAMEMAWEDVLPSSRCSYVLGNPPFGGPKYASPEHRKQIMGQAGIGAGAGTLDYVTGWFLKASEYAAGGTRIGFVATNSITQGEQVWPLWTSILGRYGMEITFAYRPFKWDSEARGKANVYVVVIGLAKRGAVTKKRLFEHDGKGILETAATEISPYLFDTNRTVLVQKTKEPLNGLQPMKMGSKPIDGGNYIFGAADRDEFLKTEPAAAQFLQEYVNAKDFINGNNRWILALHDASPAEINRMPEVGRRMQAVMEMRLRSSDSGTRKLAETPTLYHLNVLPKRRFLAIPELSSERRKYVPIGFLDSPTIPSNTLMVVENAEPGLFGLMTSRMHMVWLREIGGNLEMRLRYSAGIVYNAFPVPDGSLDKLEGPARRVLEVRERHADSSFADLYNTQSMPPDLSRAHRDLDRKVERMYRKQKFESDQERIDFLLDRYAKMVGI